MNLHIKHTNSIRRSLTFNYANFQFQKTYDVKCKSCNNIDAPDNY